MSKWRARTPIMVLAVVAVLGPGCRATDLSAVDPDRPEIDAVFAEYDSPDSPGCALGVLADGEWMYRHGYGMANLEHDVPIDADSVFRIGSTSKQFSAMVMLLLEEEGVLSLDDDIRQHLPQMPDFGEPITIRQLIHHTSGLRDYLTLMELAGYREEDYYDDRQLYRMLARQSELNFPPGTDHLYSNSGYFLLSQVVLQTTGKSLRQVARERIFEPLGMDRTHYHDDWTEIVEGRATGYAPDEEEGGFRISVTTLPMTGDGGVFTTVNDLAAWDRNFYDNRLASGSRELIDRWLQPATLDDGTEIDYSAGIVDDSYRGLRLISHGGSFVGYRADMLRFPEQRTTVIVLCNVASANPSALGRRVADVVLADAATEPVPGPGEVEDSAATTGTEEVEGEGDEEGFLLPAAELRDYAGTYHSEELDAEYRLEVEEGHLVARVRERAPLRLRAVADDRFELLEGRATMEFRRDAAGNVLGFRLDAGRVRDLGFLRVD